MLEAPLFECYLDEKGEPIVRPIDSGVLIWRNATYGKTHSIVHVYTRSALAQFVKDAKLTTSYLFEAAREELPGATSSLGSS